MAGHPALGRILLEPHLVGLLRDGTKLIASSRECSCGLGQQFVQKNERPMGGPAARAWDGGYNNPKSVRFFRPFGCAREQQDDTQEQTSYNHSVTPESPTNS